MEREVVREVGEALGLPSDLVWRQPFPGPGLAVRCLGEVTPERIQRLREADAIVLAEIVVRRGLAFFQLRFAPRPFSRSQVMRFLTIRCSEAAAKIDSEVSQSPQMIQAMQILLVDLGTGHQIVNQNNTNNA